MVVVLVKGLLVCFEGIDGSGKMTQAGLLMKALSRKGARCILLSYPDYGSDYGKMIDMHLHGHMKASVAELFLLFLADMAKDAEKVRKSVASGSVVICDRYFYSTIAYQCAAGFSYVKAKAFESAAGLPRPSCVFYLDIPQSLTYSRKMKQKGSADRNESDEEYMGRVRRYYSKMMRDGYSGAEWVRIDGTMPAGRIHRLVMGKIREMKPALGT